MISEKTPLTELSLDHDMESSWGACAATNGVKGVARDDLEDGCREESKREPKAIVGAGRNGQRLHHSQSRYPSDSSEETGTTSGQVSPRMVKVAVEYEEVKKAVVFAGEGGGEGLFWPRTAVAH